MLRSVAISPMSVESNASQLAPACQPKDQRVRRLNLLTVAMVALLAIMFASEVAPVAAQDATPTASGSTAATTSSSQSDDQARAELAEKYKPVVSLRQQRAECDRSGEGYFPAPIETVLGTPDVVLKKRTGRNSSQDTVMKVAPVAQDLVGLGADYYLDWPGNPVRPGCDFERWFRQRVTEMGAVPTTYAHYVVDTKNNQLFLQYWFWYTFNDWNNTHEGDWEMVQFVFDTTSVADALTRDPIQVGFAQHGGGELADPDDDRIEWSDGHIVAYPAAGSHGTFYGSETYIGWGEDGSGFGCDITTAPQQQYGVEVVIVPDVIDPAGPFAWLLFEGRWGERAPLIWDGPLGPNVNRRWSDPFTATEFWRTSSIAIPRTTLVGPNATRLFCTLSKQGSVFVTRIVVHPYLLLATVLLVLGALAWLIYRAWNQIVAAWRAYRQDWKLYMLLGLATIPISIVVNILDIWLRSRPPIEFLIRWFNDTAGARLSLALALGGIQQIFIIVLVAPPVIRTIYDRRRGLRPTLRSSVFDSWRYIPRVAATLFVAVLIVGALSLTLIGIPIAIFLAVAWQFLAQTTTYENRFNPFAAIRRSRSICGRNWIYALKTSLIFQGLLWVPGPFVGALLLIFGTAGVNLANLFSGIVYALTIPLAVIGITLAYLNLRERHEGAPTEDVVSGPAPSALRLDAP